ncbi:MBL fold metallo-hydrolase [Limnohabitans sp.]|uniref:MBL fold metallo-hydrolase n=1 Tax=Limnohabitans sp. TaxID=1907725 RepID=UPI00286F3AD9|nr:MBL fold metallo-hydrolase [Limnohabitans sp.]
MGEVIVKAPFVRSLCVSLWLACLGLAISAHAENLLPQETATQPLMQAKEVVPNVYYVEGVSEMGSSANQNFISNAGFVVTPAGVVVIDALGSPELAHRLVVEIAKVTDKPIHTVVLTHYHADHIYGLQVFQDLGARIVAHGAAREYLTSDAARLRLEISRQELWPWVDEKTRLVPADEWLTASKMLMVGGVRFDIQPVGPSHTAEDLVVYLPKQKVLFAGDLVFRNRIPFVGQADSRHWIEAMRNLLQFDTRWIVPGHGPISNDPKGDMTLTRDYLIYLREAMGRAAKDMEPFESAYTSTDWSKFEKMPLFKSANRMNAYNTYLLMEHESK